MTPPPSTREGSARTGAPRGKDAAAILARALAFVDAAVAVHPMPTFRLADFQQAALVAARHIIEVRGGVLIADGVGLGKTFVALALIEEELRRGGRVLVTSPAALRRHWQLPLLRLARKHGCSTYGLRNDSVAARVGVPHLEWLSHTRLSRGWRRSELLVPQSLTVVDEAHGCRNPATRRYRTLAAACAHGRVALLTATPICNSLSDLYFLIRLFASDRAFQDIGVMDLHLLLRAERPDMDRVRAVLGAVMVRRTRAELATTNGGVRLPDGRSFPSLGPPDVIRYSGGPSVLKSLRLIEGLRFPAFDVSANGRDAHAAHGGELLRCMLLKRLESSEAAARASVFRLTRYMTSFLDALKRGRLLTARDFRQLVCSERGVEQLLLQQLVLAELPPRIDRGRLERDCRSDLGMLAELAESLDRRNDEKLSVLRDRLRDAAGVIVFTEFQETARLLWDALLRDGRRVGRIDGNGAWLGAQRATRAAVIARFAPHATGSRAPHARERVDILVATDLLSEGLNLQDAHTVVSYDLPWNPTRLMQRVGRIDRLGSPHDAITAAVFMPGDHLEAMLGLVRRIRGKLRVIHESVGAEGSPLGPGVWIPDADTIEALRDGRIMTGTAENLRSAQALINPVRIIGECMSCAQVPESSLPEAAALECNGEKNGVLLLGTLGRMHAASFYDPATGLLAPLDAGEVRSLLSHCTTASRRADDSRVDAALAKVSAMRVAAPVASPATMRAARLVLRALARAGGSIHPATLGRAEVVLQRLRAGLPLGPELALRALLRAPLVDADSFIDALEGILPVGPTAREETRFRPLIALDIGPAGATDATFPIPRLVDTSACGG